MSSMTLGELLVKIKSDTSGLKAGLDKARASTKEAERGIQSSTNSMVSSFKNLVAAGLTIGAVVVALKKCVSAATENERAVSKLNQVIQSTAGIAGVTSEEAQRLASSLQAVTTFGDEAIMGGQTLLLTFTKIGRDIFPEATEAMLDMSEVLGQDLKSSAIQLGKALNDPIQGVSALRRVGVQLSQQQEDQIKQFMELGDVASAQKIILGELSTQMGGQAKAAAQTFTGQVKQIDNSIGDLAERIGKKVLPALKEMVGVLNEGLKGIERVFAQSDLIASIKATEEELTVLKERKTILEGNEIAQKGLNKQIADATAKLKEYRKLLRISQGIVSAGGTREDGKFTPLKTPGATEGRTLTDEEKKAYADKQKQLQSINESYQMKNFERSASDLDKLNIQEIQAQLEVQDLKYINAKAAEEARLNITKYFAEERKKVELETAQEVAQASFAFTSQTVGQLGQLFADYTQNKITNLEQEKQAGLDKISAQYDAEVANINATVANQRERDARLKALDEKRARDEKKLTEKIEKEKRKANYEAAKIQKGIDIAQASSNAALAITNILAKWAAFPVTSAILIGITSAITAAQIALIAARPLPALAEGGFFQGPAVIGEAGREFALPLDGDQGRNAMREMADAILDQMATQRNTSATVDNSRGGGGGAPVGNVYLDGALVGTWAYSASENGNLRINARAVVS